MSLILAYGAVFLSFTSGLFGTDDESLLNLGQYWFKKLPANNKFSDYQ